MNLDEELSKCETMEDLTGKKWTDLKASWWNSGEAPFGYEKRFWCKKSIVHGKRPVFPVIPPINE